MTPQLKCRGCGRILDAEQGQTNDSAVCRHCRSESLAVNPATRATGTASSQRPLGDLPAWLRTKEEKNRPKEEKGPSSKRNPCQARIGADMHAQSTKAPKDCARGSIDILLCLVIILAAFTALLLFSAYVASRESRPEAARNAEDLADYFFWAAFCLYIIRTVRRERSRSDFLRRRAACTDRIHGSDWRGVPREDARSLSPNASDAGALRSTLRGHSDTVCSVAFSSDGQRLGTGSHDRTAKIWDATSGQELLTLHGHSSFVLSVAFSPNRDRLATGSLDNTARIWDATTGRELLVLAGHSRQVTGVVLSPDGQRLATGGGDNTARIWDATTGQELLVLNGHSRQVTSVAFSPDGQRLATGSEDNTARIWDATTGHELLALHGHAGFVLGVAFSPDRNWLATGSADNTAKIWTALAAWRS